jgi:MFS family permease
MNKTFKRLYFNDKELTQKDYRRSQFKMILSGSTASVINVLTVGTFLVGFLKYLGASTQYLAIIGAIPQLGCILQMFSPIIFERLKHRKLLICICCFLFRFSIGTIIFVPFIVHSTSLRLLIIMIIYTFGYLVAGFVTPGLNNWYLSVAPEKGRGKFLSIKDIGSMISVSVFSILVSKMLDYFKIQNRMMTGFIIMFGVSLILSILDFILISKIEEPIAGREFHRYKIMELILTPLKDKKFKTIIIFLSIWYFAVQFSVSFIPIVMLSSLELSYSFISLITVTGSILGIFSTYLWGRFADATSWLHLLKISGCMIAFCYFGWAFVTVDNAKILVFLLQVLLTCCNGAFHMAISNLQYNLSPSAGKTAYLGVTSAIAYVISFIGALLGTVLSKWIKLGNIDFLIVSIPEIQILFLITSMLLLTALIFIKDKRGLM